MKETFYRIPFEDTHWLVYGYFMRPERDTDFPGDFEISRIELAPSTADIYDYLTSGTINFLRSEALHKSLDIYYADRTPV